MANMDSVEKVDINEPMDGSFVVRTCWSVLLNLVYSRVVKFKCNGKLCARLWRSWTGRFAVMTFSTTMMVPWV